MSKDNVISLENLEENPDILTGLLRSGTRELIKKAVQITGKVSASISGCVRFSRKTVGSAQRLLV